MSDEIELDDEALASAAGGLLLNMQDRLHTNSPTYQVNSTIYM